MPNGGSDCCGTCWFNSKNEGEPGYHGNSNEGTVICTIRNIEIPAPFYTYCINHPHHNPKKVDVPLGAIYVGFERNLWLKGPDDEKTRLALLGLLAEMAENPMNEYPFGRSLDEEIIVQIGALREIRAVKDLKRIVNFNPFALPLEKAYFDRNRIITIAVAIEALAKISFEDGLSELEKLSSLGLENQHLETYNPKKDRFAPIRYHVIRGLKYTQDDRAMDLLKKGLLDPHQEIKAFAINILEEKIGKKKTKEILLNLKNGSDFLTNQSWWKFWKKNYE